MCPPKITVPEIDYYYCYIICLCWAGQASTCWSPGQRDTDCPQNGLCCFDGCANTCGDAPKGEHNKKSVFERF